MPDDPKTISALARIEAGQQHLGSRIDDMGSRHEKLADAMAVLADATSRGLTEIKVATARLVEQVNGHEQRDEERFEAVREDIRRSHEKISRLRSVSSAAASPSPTKRDDDPGVGRGVKAGIGAGLVGGLTALFYALAKYFGGGDA